MKLSKDNNNEIKNCINCNKLLIGKQLKFCSSSCSAKYNNSRRVIKKKEKLIKEDIKKIKITKKKDLPSKTCPQCKETYQTSSKDKIFCSRKCTSRYYSIKHSKEQYEYFLNNPKEFNRANYTPKCFKKYFLIEQDNKCDICKCEPKHNNKELVFILDHIDGDASNNNRDNLRLVCPNCDSQLETFKSKNKNSTRRNYWKEKIIKDNT